MVDLMGIIDVGIFPLMIVALFCPHRYNKRDFDFPSLREYNDYLEQVEDIGKSYPKHNQHLKVTNHFISEPISELSICITVVTNQDVGGLEL